MKKITALLTFLFLLTGCGLGISTAESEDSDVSSESINIEELGDITTFKFKHDIPMEGIFTVNITEDWFMAHFDFETYFDYSENSDRHVVSDKKVGKAIFKEIASICEKYDIYSWDGFDSEAGEGVMDADSISLTIEFDTGKTISAYASGGFPINSQEFIDELHEYTLEIAK